MQKKTSKQNNKSATAAQTEQGELQQPIWAVIDREGTRLQNVSYADAHTSVSKNAGTIITSQAASRADGGLLKT